MDTDDVHVAGDFFLHPITSETTRRKTFFEHFQRFMPAEMIVYIQYCLLRIPFVLIYDYLFTDKFSSIIDNSVINSTEIYSNGTILITNKPFHVIFRITLQLLISTIIPLVALILLILLLLTTDKRLVIFYSYTISFLVIYFDYQMNLISENTNTSSINMYILQFLLSTIYIQMLNIRPRMSSYKIQTRLCHCAPLVLIITRYLNSSIYSLYLLRFYYLIWIIAHLSELIICHRDHLVDILGIRSIEELFHLYRNLGFQTLLNYIQTQIHIGTLLKVFWITKIIVLPLGFRTIYTNPFVVTNLTEMNSTIVDYNQTTTKTIYFTTLFYGTETMFTLISLACLISHLMKLISHRLFRFLHLWTEDVEQIGTVVGVMFFLLLFQSNITHLDLNRRHVPLLKAFSLLIVALFHFIHTILEPQLLKVAMQTMTTRMAFNQFNENQPTNTNDSQQQPNINILRSYRHQHVYTCLSLLILVIIYLIFLWQITTVSTWLLAVTAFSFELIVRLIASLAQFTVYVLDAHNRLANVDSFDEYLFRIKAVTSVLEFILGVFLLFNGFYILCFESRGALRALMLAIHAHLNIIKNLKRGYQIFRNRKSAWHNVNQLPLASEEQINEYNDICSICHNSLTSGVACITPCSHIFHQKCLQKAFYATQNCALCSRPIIFENNQHRE